MNSPSFTTLQNQMSVVDILNSVGLVSPTKLGDALQGSVHRCTQLMTNKTVVVKAVSKELHSKSMVILNGRPVRVHENILIESTILEALSKDPKCPKSIVRHEGFLESQSDYFLVLEDGGSSLFDFTVKIHKYIAAGYLDVSQWLELAKLIFGQMAEAVAYLHSRHICHFDVSLENFVISNVMIQSDGNKFTFCGLDAVKVTLIDFGLANIFEKGASTQSFKFCGKTAYQSPEITANHGAPRHKLRSFDAMANDVWCLGISLFMMVFGTSPWKYSMVTERAFVKTMCQNGDVTHLLTRWKRMDYADENLIALFKLIFKYEQTRGGMKEVMANKWARSSQTSKSTEARN